MQITVHPPDFAGDKNVDFEFPDACLFGIGVRAGGVRGAAAPPNFGQLRFFGQQEKTWAKLTFKDVSCFFMSILERQIFSILT